MYYAVTINPSLFKNKIGIIYSPNTVYLTIIGRKGVICFFRRIILSITAVEQEPVKINASFPKE
jgi:hypothetical protein